MSGVSVAYAGNGTFSVTVNGKSQTLNMADLNAMLRMEQVEGMDQTIADQLSEIRTTNEKRKALNQLLSHMRKQKSDGRDDHSTNASQAGAAEKVQLEGESGTKTVKEWMDHLGITWTDVQGDKDKATRDGNWDANISAVKSQIDNITSDSEMQMLRFRQMVDKRGTALQEAKTTLSNDKRLKDAIVQG